jgi:hypothetical protein
VGRGGPALHALSHLVDTKHADGQIVGWLEFAGLTFGTVVLALACAVAWSAQRRAEPVSG